MALKLRPPMLRTIKLTGVSVKSGKIWLFDAKGNRVGVVCDSFAFPCGDAVASGIEWRLAIRRMVLKFERQRSKQSYSMTDGWERKLLVWIKSQEGPVRRPKYTRFFSPARRATWEDAITCMKYQFGNANAKVRLKSDQWMQWAETVSRNHRHKEATRGRKNTAENNDRGPRIQMQWNWRGSSASVGKP